MDRTPAKIGRNQPCPCGSGKKYKKCCLRKDQPSSSAEDRIEALMQDGYRESMAGRPGRACELWNETWQLIRARLEPQMRTTDQAEAVFSGTQLIHNWLQDFSTELLNAALENGPRFGTIGVRFCQDVLAQFTDESEGFKTFVRGDMGDILCRAGRFDEGEKIFLELIRDQPDSAIGYVKLADALADLTTDTQTNLERARSLLEQALAKSDAKDFDVAYRLAHLGRPSLTAPA
jgi:tetratricopeptide (TPR) repeat protein